MNNLISKKCDGVAMVEFAIILPLLLMLLFGITELGRALYQQNSLYKAVESGARYLARSNGTLDTNAGCAKRSSWATHESAATKLIVYGNVAGTGTPLLPFLDDSDVTTITVGVEERSLTKTDGIAMPTCVIIITAAVPFAGMFGDIVIPFTSIEAFSIRAETEERYIGL